LGGSTTQSRGKKGPTIVIHQQLVEADRPTCNTCDKVTRAELTATRNCTKKQRAILRALSNICALA